MVTSVEKTLLTYPTLFCSIPQAVLIIKDFGVSRMEFAQWYLRQASVDGIVVRSDLLNWLYETT